MAHLIRVKNNLKDFPYDEVNQVTPWPTLRHEPGQSWAEISKKMNSTVLSDGKNLKDKWDNPKYPFRVFKSHGASRQCCPMCTFVVMPSKWMQTVINTPKTPYFISYALLLRRGPGRL